MTNVQGIDPSTGYEPDGRQEPMLEGETFQMFADRFGITMDELFRYNKSKRPPKNRIYFGQRLNVPAGAIDRESSDAAK